MAASHMDTMASPSYNEPVAETERRKVCGIDMNYARSIYGTVKLAQVYEVMENCLRTLKLFFFFTHIAPVSAGLLLVAFIAGTNVRAIFFAIVTFFAFFLNLVLFFGFATSLHKNVKLFNWYYWDLVISGVGVPVLFLFSTLTVTSIFRPVILAAGIFGFIDMIAFGINTFFAFKRYRENKQRLARQPEYQVDY
ncbi:putative CKLF-like MARVEL transmembrane domain-containing protein 4 isoform X1 [Apostichopus japonicus]|uniref:Putative CKLF-like MARVEL transmembrane domain-containing protein 4 isoform X1 n=1 Tax=Stichopus japonicus TaxID=307972 RepID=A0A2G8L220_STIJA|nr:putative CKLF-like MARVEL transmembrane domain-containing protein 4 isoform X1 [Apostichopus japonicus]